MEFPGVFIGEASTRPVTDPSQGTALTNLTPVQCQNTVLAICISWKKTALLQAHKGHVWSLFSWTSWKKQKKSN